MEKELAVVLGATGNMAFAVANVLMGLRDFLTGYKYDVIIYHKNISENDKTLLNSILPCDFIDYNSPKNNNFNTEQIKRFSLLCFSKYECFNLLKDYKNVLWLDIDIFIKDHINELIPMGEKGIALLKSSCGGTVRGNFIYPVSGYNMDKKSFETGVFVLNRNLPHYEKLAEWCYKKTDELASKLFFPDQAIINLMLQEFSIESAAIPIEIFSCCLSSKLTSKAKILHSCGKKKFWNYYNVKGWNRNYKIWLNMGGGRYTGGDFNAFGKMPNPIKFPRRFFKYIKCALKNR